MMAAFGSVDDLDGGSSRSSGAAGISACIEPAKGLYGPVSAPPELLDFLCAQSVRETALALGLARGTVHRLVKGYWPNDPRKIVLAWSAYKGRAAVVASSWFLRRVRLGGVVRHAGGDFSAPRLAARTGQMLAVARDRDGGLVAQTLELPAERMPLIPTTQTQQGSASVISTTGISS